MGVPIGFEGDASVGGLKVDAHTTSTVGYYKRREAVNWNSQPVWACQFHKYISFKKAEAETQTVTLTDQDHDDPESQPHVSCELLDQRHCKRPHPRTPLISDLIPTCIFEYISQSQRIQSDVLTTCYMIYNDK